LAYIRWSNLFVCLRLPSRETWLALLPVLSISPLRASRRPSNITPPHPTPLNACRQSPPWDETTCFTTHPIVRAPTREKSVAPATASYLFILGNPTETVVCVSLRCGCILMFCGPPTKTPFSSVSLQHAAKCLMLCLFSFCFQTSETCMDTYCRQVTPIRHRCCSLLCLSSVTQHQVLTQCFSALSS
jgi:hypothetical protein